MSAAEPPPPKASAAPEPPAAPKLTQAGQAVVRDGRSWRILALRVEFPLEDPDEPTTSGDGTFDTRGLGEALGDYVLPFDTPPHDGIYFGHHLDALARYYRAVSDGRLEIEYTVLPTDPGAAYRMPQRALIYGNGRTPEQIDEKWLQLLNDAVAAADDDVVFSDYNSFLVFHAGLGHETGELNDIRSVFLDSSDIASAQERVTADRGAFELPDAWIMPEAVNVRGRAGLNGLLAKFFGFQLGLQGLSNTADGVPGLGGWSLMDVGATRLGFVRIEDELEPGFGFVPPHPMAWSKMQLGWIDPLTVRRDTVVAVVATDRPLAVDDGLATSPRAVKIPISPTEYFLLENRQQRGRRGLPEGVAIPFGEENPVWLEQAEIEYSHTVSAEEAGDRSELTGAGGGVWLSAAEYDAFVPGSGILVWHVDEAAMATGLAAGGINNDRERPGIALVEADGFRHIGNVFFDLQAFTEGTQEDPFFAGEATSGERGVTRFGADTQPASLTNTGLDPGVEVEVLSGPGDTMRVQVHFTRIRPGWPVPVAGGRLLQAAAVGDAGAQRLIVEAEDGVRLLDADGRQQWAGSGLRYLAAATTGPGLLFVSTAESIQAWSPGIDDGSPAWSLPWTSPVAAALYSEQLQLSPGVGSLAVAGADGITLAAAVDGEILQQWRQPAAALNVADLDGDGSRELVAASPGGVRGWVVTATELTPLWSDESGRLPPVSGDLDGDGRDEVITLSPDGILHVITADGEASHRFSLADDGVLDASPALGDVDGDGFLEIVLAAGGSIQVMRGYGGLSQPGFPSAAPRHHEAGPLTLTPVLVDLEADGRQEIIAGASTGVYGFDDDGVVLPGFPLLADGPVSFDPALVDLDGSGGVAIAALTRQRLYVWDPDRLAQVYRGGEVGWGQHGFSAAGPHAHRRTERGPMPTAAAELLPASRAYCYPNPVSGEGRAHLRFFLSAAATVELEVYDAIGERVERLSFDGSGFVVPAENEIQWSTADYASGLYICRVAARTDAGEEQQVVVRMAVSR